MSLEALTILCMMRAPVPSLHSIYQCYDRGRELVVIKMIDEVTYGTCDLSELEGTGGPYELERTGTGGLERTETIELEDEKFCD